jgi:hypothetical protein
MTLAGIGNGRVHTKYVVMMLARCLRQLNVFRFPHTSDLS